MKKPFVIAIDWIDGSGKTTQARLLQDSLTARGHNVYSHRFVPSTTAYLIDIAKRSGQSVRQHFNLPYIEYVYACDELINYSKILEHEKDADVIIQDGWKLRRLVNAYYANSDVDNVVEILNEIPDPDLLFVLDVTPEIAMERILRRGGATPDETMDYLSKASCLYRKLASKSANAIVVDSWESTENVQVAIVGHIMPFLK